MPKAKFQREYFLLSLIIFTLPFNWFLKWETDSAFLRGIKIDYLLPKLYLQDILLFCLGIYLLYSYRTQVSPWLANQVVRLYKLLTHGIKRNRLPISVQRMWSLIKRNVTRLSFTGLMLVVTLKSISSRELSTFMSLWQLLSATGLAYYLCSRFSFNELLQRIWKPLFAAAIFQSILGIYQFIFQKSLIGYILFGEIDLSSPGAIARESFFGALRVLPYGTLPHPNILAGFLGIASLMILLELRFVRKLNQYLSLKRILLGLFIFVTLLTQSWVAISGLLLLYTTSFLTSRYMYRLLFGLYTIVTIVYLLLPTWYIYQSVIDSGNESIIRRIKLNQAGISVLHDHLWFGTGLNQSLKPMHTTYSMLAPADFIQPIHSIYLLWLVETGVIGASLTALLVTSLSKRSPDGHYLVDSTHSTSSQLLCRLWLIPFLFIAWLGIFDHYIVTIRQGQLLAALAIALTLSSATKSKK